MPVTPDNQEATTKLPCRKCMIIRYFLLAVFGLGLTALISPNTLNALQGMSSLQVASIFIGALGLGAVCKAAAEIFSARKSTR